MASQENSVSARGGFTLLELLVVMLIVVVAIAILYPVMASVREKGRQAVCLSHVSQHARAVLMYAQDYDERLPVAWNRTLANKPEDETIYPHWWNVLQPYVPNKGVFQCPDDTGYVGMKPGDPNNEQPFYPEFGSSYHSLVGWLPASDTSSLPLPRQPGGLGGVSLASVLDPTRTVLSYDSWPYWHGGLLGEDEDAARVNASYLDGSARRSRSRYVATLLAQGPGAVDGSRNIALGDLPQIDPNAPAVTSTSDNGSTHTSADGSQAGPDQGQSDNGKHRNRLATKRGGKRPPPTTAPHLSTSDNDIHTASDGKQPPAVQDSPKSSPFGAH
jgi:prepilin-type N-terminal cleavage/methylation domain-containing protein